MFWKNDEKIKFENPKKQGRVICKGGLSVGNRSDTKCKKFFSKLFLLGFWPKTFLTSMKVIYFLKLVSVKILLKMNAHQKAKPKTYLDDKVETLSQLYIVSDDMNFLKQNAFNFLFVVI